MTRRWQTTRTILGAVAALAVVGVVAGGALVPWRGITHQVPVAEVVPAPADTVLACTGPILALGRDASEAGALAVAESMALTAGNAQGGQPEQVPMTQERIPGASDAPSLVQSADARQTVSVAAAASAQVSSDDISGYAASACAPGSLESWLVGGATATGNTGIVLLANPGDTAATVRMTVYGATGPSTPPGAGPVTVPARSQVALPLAGIAAEEPNPVLQVTATGSPVRATLQSSLVRTLDPAGLDVQGSVVPAPTHIIPGVRVTGEETSASDTRVRMLSPYSDTAVTVTVTHAEQAEPVREPQTLELVAGTPTVLDLPGLERGAYTVRIVSEAGEKVVAAVRQASDSGEDYAWLPAAPVLEGSAFLAVPEGPSPRLYLANSGDDDTEVTLGSRTVTVPAGQTASVAVDAGSLQSLEAAPQARLHAAVVFADEDALGGFAVTPDPALPEPVPVLPGR